ncbi:hypothetical protein CDAR_530731 [Caerostris darwini]|uniref:Uncharacterized protein n=1 Tax=Caerostris darwini TaxID=1538125 RepID=A0AAV4PLV6_9ARAC|nr:hypothetical protein CDAR_530731 [Caerostris darwini]
MQSYLTLYLSREVYKRRNPFGSFVTVPQGVSRFGDFRHKTGLLLAGMAGSTSHNKYPISQRSTQNPFSLSAGESVILCSKRKNSFEESSGVFSSPFFLTPRKTSLVGKGQLDTILPICLVSPPPKVHQDAPEWGKLMYYCRKKGGRRPATITYMSLHDESHLLLAYS